MEILISLNSLDGTFTPPFMDKDDPVYIFVDEMRRSDCYDTKHSENFRNQRHSSIARNAM